MQRKQLRKLFQEKGIIVAPGAHNGVSAKVIEKIGFKAIYATGYGASANVLGKPDIGLMSMSEMVTHMHNMANATSLPIIADADTGYGNAINVMRTVQEYEQAGVAALQLEDQVMPKKCGHMMGRELISMKEMVGKIEAAVSARRDNDLMIIARTDARTKYGIEEAIRRGKAYEKAGADIIFIESPESKDEMKLINQSIKAPTLANMVENGRTPLLPSAELERLGYKLVIFPVTSVLAEANILSRVFKELFETGTTDKLVSDSLLFNFEEFNNFLGAKDMRNLEKKYLPQEVVE
jgi:carboxyvinyl-carboxyphosphonate phosphorylmutase